MESTKKFDAFIHPKKNESLSLKDRRFHRIFACCYSLVDHMDDNKSYLEKFSSVFKGLPTIDCSFLNMEVLKFFVCVTSLIGIHITGPYQLFLINVDTSYDTLLQEFPTLYQGLNNIKEIRMLNTERKMFNFLENSTFKKLLAKECVVHSINSCMH